MKIYNILKEENIGEKYMDENGFKWVIIKDKINGLNLKTAYSKESDCINKYYNFDQILKMSFCEISVTFNDILHSDNIKCKVEHKKLEENINDFNSEIKWVADTIEKIKNDEYIDFSKLMATLGMFVSTKQLKEIIKNGKWDLCSN